jgi:hypothetical protein
VLWIVLPVVTCDGVGFGKTRINYYSTNGIESWYLLQRNYRLGMSVASCFVLTRKCRSGKMRGSRFECRPIYMWMCELA